MPDSRSHAGLARRDRQVATREGTGGTDSGMSASPGHSGHVMIALFGLFAEVERDLISERTKEGLAVIEAPMPLLKLLR